MSWGGLGKGWKEATQKAVAGLGDAVAHGTLARRITGTSLAAGSGFWSAEKAGSDTLLCSAMHRRGRRVSYTTSRGSAQQQRDERWRWCSAGVRPAVRERITT